MHVQIITYQLKDISEQEYGTQSKTDALIFATFPGLQSKIWLADPATNTYGGIYLWKNRHAMDAFVQSDLFKTIAARPFLTNITTKDYGVLDEATQITFGLHAQHAPM